MTHRIGEDLSVSNFTATGVETYFERICGASSAESDWRALAGWSPWVI